ncbi:MAG: hypothetical protein AAGK37_12495 [Pseudomonadota bacterium]
MTLTATHDSAPHAWSHQLAQSKPEDWSAGYGILVLSGLMWVWYASLIARFTSEHAFGAGLVWLLAMVVWLMLQVFIARAHLPERNSHVFPTLVQALLPTGLTLAAVIYFPSLREAAVQIAIGAGATELIAIHILRLSAWGTISKFLKGQLPGYFFRFGSIPDFGFAIFSVIATAWLLVLDSPAPPGLLVAYSIAGIAAFFGAATTMYFGVPGSALSWRWSRVEMGEEAPTFLPFRWPMNLAPSFCGPVFWLAHCLLIAKVLMA